jgi:hypothetical protein
MSRPLPPPEAYGPSQDGRGTTTPYYSADTVRRLLAAERRRIYRLIADDAMAISYQSMGQYRSALLAAFRTTEKGGS